jgi:tripartite-type tricarboxylate transporter receptor subunit TctC
VREKLLAQGAEPAGNSPEEFASFVKSEIAKWRKVVKDSGATAE